ncbi:hypothetical protein, partial [Sulfobacillus harzensis]
MARRTGPLTAAEQAQLAAYHRKYLAAGLATAPADRPRAEAALARAYELAGHTPVPVIWVDSPLTANLLIAMLQRQRAGHPSDQGGRDSLGASLGVSLGASLGASLRTSLRTSLGASLGVSLGASLGVSLGASLGVSLGASLGASLRTSLRTS